MESKTESYWSQSSVIKSYIRRRNEYHAVGCKVSANLCHQGEGISKNYEGVSIACDNVFLCLFVRDLTFVPKWILDSLFYSQRGNLKCFWCVSVQPKKINASLLINPTGKKWTLKLNESHKYVHSDKKKYVIPGVRHCPNLIHAFDTRQHLWEVSKSSLVLLFFLQFSIFELWMLSNSCIAS